MSCPARGHHSGVGRVCREGCVIEPALIGRDTCLGVLRAGLRRAHASHGGLVLVTGEAGIGKTSLVRHAAQEDAAWRL
ncbi:ATP-binding protein [Streptomyces sp. NPDC000229]|uniref:ATP-binding protein n=1 Tax=Streptomyces sp. NPDC000229 TaxID=3154247 RepID=UPI0033340CB0